MDDVMAMEQAEKAYIGLAGESPRRESKRSALLRRKAQLNRSLESVQKALDALDAHPELEEFIETLSNSGV
jgi:hypothetical protein